MGFLSSIFGHVDDDDELEQEEEAQAEEEQQPELPELTVGMVFDATIISGPPLLSGRLTAFTDTELTLERKPGQLSFQTCSEGTEVNLRGLLKGMPFDLRGCVAESTKMKLRVRDIKVIPYNESRNNFRVELEIPISLYDPDDVMMENAEEAQMVNLSVTGACFQSEYIHGEGEVLRMKFQIMDYVPRAMLGEVVRVEEAKEGRFRYGFLFAQLDDQDATALTRELYNVQKGKKNIMLRHGYGHW